MAMYTWRRDDALPVARFMFTNALLRQRGRLFCRAVRPVPCRDTVRFTTLYGQFRRLARLVLPTGFQPMSCTGMAFVDACR